MNVVDLNKFMLIIWSILLLVLLPLILVFLVVFSPIILLAKLTEWIDKKHPKLANFLDGLALGKTPQQKNSK